MKKKNDSNQGANDQRCTAETAHLCSKNHSSHNVSRGHTLSSRDGAIPAGLLHFAVRVHAILVASDILAVHTEIDVVTIEPF